MRPTRPLLPLLALLAGVLAAPGARAQEAPFDLDPGDRIEIAAPTLDPRLVPATVTQRGPTWIGFALEDGQVWTRYLYRIDEIRVRRAVPVGRRARAGAAWGLFLGASLGGIAGPFVARAIDGETPAWTAVGLSAGVGAAAGSALGALIGAAVPRAAWTHYRFGAEGPRR